MPDHHMTEDKLDQCQQCKQTISRTVLAGPVVLLASIVVMAGAALWLPKGAAGINNIAVPLVLYPLIWCVLFFYTCLSQQLRLAWSIVIGITAVNAAAIAWQLLVS